MSIAQNELEHRGVVLLVLALVLVVGAAFACGTSAPSEPTTPRVADAPLPPASESPERAPVEPRVAAARDMSCALRGGSVYCWGGRGRDSAPRKFGGASGAVAVAAGWSRVCVILGDGTVACSRGGGRAVSPVEGVGAAVALSVGPSHACAVGPEGKVWCWGQSSYGALGVPDEGRDAWDQSAVEVTGMTDAVGVAAGEYHSCALRRDGRVSCWGMGADPRITCSRGRNSVSCSGPSNATPHLPRGVAGVANAVHIEAGEGRTCAVQGDGTVSCWDMIEHDGSNEWVPRRVDGVEGARRVSVGVGYACALGDGTVRCWGDDDRGQLGAGDATGGAVAGIDDAVDVAAGEHHACIVREDGQVLCWGANEWGQVGDGSQGFDGSPISMTLPGVAEVEGGGELFCTRDENGAVRCAGNNDMGQLGDGTTEARTQLAPVLDLGRTNQVDLSSGAQACAVDRGGVLRCWGDNSSLHAGASFSPEPPVLSTPRRVEGVGVVAEVATNSVGTCALSRSGRVSCFGRRAWANDDPTHGPVPNLGRATHLVAGERHFCATLADGQVRCWGSGSSGQLGGPVAPGQSRNPNALVTVGGLDDVSRVAAGCSFNCALRRDGTVACWGANRNGELGPGHDDDVSSEIPLTVDGVPNASAVGAGCMHACAQTAGGSIVCWGENDRGQLGNGSTSAATGLVTLPARGRLHVLAFATCVDDGAGALRCFGDVPGVSRRADRSAPVPVVGLPPLR